MLHWERVIGGLWVMLYVLLRPSACCCEKDLTLQWQACAFLLRPVEIYNLWLTSSKGRVHLTLTWPFSLRHAFNTHINISSHAEHFLLPCYQTSSRHSITWSDLLEFSQEWSSHCLSIDRAAERRLQVLFMSETNKVLYY